LGNGEGKAFDWEVFGLFRALTVAPRGEYKSSTCFPCIKHMNTIRVADEVWVATALLHRQHPGEADFTVAEIVQRAESEKITGAQSLRRGVSVHAYLHCVANKPPNSGRYRMLVETSKGRRRLFRPGDPCDPARGSGKIVPRDDEIPPDYGELIDWYRNEYVRGGKSDTAADPILALCGLGKNIWHNEDADAYVRRLRAEWQ